MGIKSTGSHASSSTPRTSESVMHQPLDLNKAKGLEKRDGVKRGRRPRSWIEKQPMKRKESKINSTSQNQPLQDMGIESWIADNNGCSFMRLLTEQLDNAIHPSYFKGPKSLHDISNFSKQNP